MGQLIGLASEDFTTKKLVMVFKNLKQNEDVFYTISEVSQKRCNFSIHLNFVVCMLFT